MLTLIELVISLTASPPLTFVFFWVILLSPGKAKSNWFLLAPLLRLNIVSWLVLPQKLCGFIGFYLILLLPIPLLRLFIVIIWSLHVLYLGIWHWHGFSSSMNRKVLHIFFVKFFNILYEHYAHALHVSRLLFWLQYAFRFWTRAVKRARLPAPRPGSVQPEPAN